jgi:hypothetical protein
MLKTRTSTNSHLLQALVALLALGVGIQVGTAAAATYTWSGVTPVPVTAPANKGAEPEAHFDWGACPTAGSCSGVGSYIDEHGSEEALAAIRTDGTWEQASEIKPPAHAQSNPKAGFGHAQPTVACTGPGACVAVGHYLNEGGGEEAMVVTETGGTWTTASEIKPPTHAATNPEARVDSVACPAAGSCLAGGDFENEHGDQEAMVVDETSGSWARASEVEPPANAKSNPEASISSVACSAASSCVAFGEYRDESTGTVEAMVATETGGTWGRASQIALPANAGNEPKSGLDSVVCAASGPCVAVGAYTDEHGNREAMVATETSGLWGQASEITSPMNAASNPQVEFSSISYAGSIACPASGSCVIAGEYKDSSETKLMVAEETSGVWGQASEIKPPANAEIGAPQAAGARIACTGVGSCVVIGSYIKEGGEREAMVAEATGGSWGQANEIALPANAASKSGVIFGPFSCPASSSCVAFGQYTNGAGKTEDMEVTGTIVPAPPVPPTIAGEFASNITESNATLEAQINPGGEAAYYFEYGTSACEANSCGTKTSEGFLTGDSGEAGSVEATNLKPNTTYHYWVVATNSAALGGVHGQAMEFTTRRGEEEVRNEEVEGAIRERVNAEAKARTEAEARTAAAIREGQEEAAAAAAAAKKKQEEAAGKSVSVKIVKVQVSSSSVTLTLDASQAGTVTISGPGLRTTSKSVAAGTSQIRVALNKTGKNDRKHHKKIKLTVQLKAAGRTASGSKTVKL